MRAGIVVKYSPCLVPENFPTLSDISDKLVCRKEDIRGRVFAAPSCLSLNKLTVSQSKISWTRPETFTSICEREALLRCFFVVCLSRLRLEETRLSESGSVLSWPAYSCRCLTILSTLNRTVSQSHSVLSASNSTNLSMDLDRRLDRSMFPTLFFWSEGNIILVALDISVAATLMA